MFMWSFGPSCSAGAESFTLGAFLCLWALVILGPCGILVRSVLWAPILHMVCIIFGIYGFQIRGHIRGPTV